MGLKLSAVALLVLGLILVGCNGSASLSATPQRVTQPSAASSGARLIVPQAQGLGISRSAFVKAFEPYGFTDISDFTDRNPPVFMVSKPNSMLDVLDLIGPADNVTKAELHFTSGDLTDELETFVNLIDPAWGSQGIQFLQDSIASSRCCPSTTFNGHSYTYIHVNGGGALYVEPAE